RSATPPSSPGRTSAVGSRGGPNRGAPRTADPRGDRLGSGSASHAADDHEGLTGLRGGDTWGTVSHVQSLFVTLFVKESPHELQAHSEEPGGSGSGDPPCHHRWKPTDRTRTPAGRTARPGRGHRSTVVEGGQIGRASCREREWNGVVCGA